MNQTMLVLVAESAKTAAEGEPDFIERIRKCMRASYGHWMVTDEEQQFSGAVAAALMLSEGEDKKRMEAAIDVMKALGAAMQGVPVDMAAVMNQHEGVEPVPLRKLWEETKVEPA